jgi:hypothetical protein
MMLVASDRLGLNGRLAVTVSEAKAGEVVTVHARTKSESSLARHLPDMWQPNFASSITETHKGLVGVLPQDPIRSITRASWHWSS